MIGLIRTLLQNCIDRIDSGNSNINTDEAIEVIELLKKYTDKDRKLSKYQACEYLNTTSEVRLDSALVESAINTLISENSNTLELRKEYDNLMGHKNWVGKISFYEPSNNPFNTPQGSIIMEAGPGIKLELAGPINYSGSNKSLSTLLK